VPCALLRGWALQVMGHLAALTGELSQLHRRLDMLLAQGRGV
jgi:hypothetical protein